MKITLTETEAKSLARRALLDLYSGISNVSAPSSEDITIERSYIGNAPTLELCKLIDVVRNCGDYKSSNKIAAIKALRECAGSMGFHTSLSDAKQFVESI